MAGGQSSGPAGADGIDRTGYGATVDRTRELRCYLATQLLITANDDGSRIQQMSYSLAFDVATTAGTAAAPAVLIRRRPRGAGGVPAPRRGPRSPGR